MSVVSTFAASISFQGVFKQDEDLKAFLFTLDSPVTVTIRTCSHAGGMNTPNKSIPGGGFDPIISFFDSTGLLIGLNNDGSCLEVGQDTATNAWPSAVADTHASSSLPSNNFGNPGNPNVGSGSQAMLRFDIAGALPTSTSSQIVAKATLHVHANRNCFQCSCPRRFRRVPCTCCERRFVACHRRYKRRQSPGRSARAQLRLSHQYPATRNPLQRPSPTARKIRVPPALPSSTSCSPVRWARKGRLVW